jgi:uncharacterized membrane protein HdeD (DUF308 family)
MTDQVQQLAKENVPWRRGVGWGIVGVEGAILLVIGLFMVFNPESARDVTRQLIAAILLSLSLLQIFGGFRNPTNPATPFHVLRGSVGATVGVIVLLERWSAYLEPEAARVILAFGLVIYGLLGLLNAIATRDEQGIRVGALITSAIAIVLGITVYTGRNDDGSRITVLGWIAIAGGAALLAFAWYLRQNPTAAEAAPAPAPARAAVAPAAVAPAAAAPAAAAPAAPPSVEQAAEQGAE